MLSAEPGSVTRPPPASSAAGSGRAPTSRDGVRPSTPEDASGINELLSQTGMRPNIEPRHMYWKYWQERADWPGSRSFVLARGKQFLAHAAIIPGAFVWEGRRIRVIHMIDWAARASAPGAGVTLMKHIARLADALLAVGGSEQTLKILPHIGFRSFGEATGYVRTLRPLRILADRSGDKWRVPPRLIRSALWILTASEPKDATPGWSTRRIGSADTHAITAVLPFRAGEASAFERSESLFAYMLDCPITPMALHLLEKDGRVRGYFLLGHAPGQVRIADCWLDVDDPFDWCALIQCAVREAKRYVDAAELVVCASGPFLASCLEKCGFHPRNTRPVQMLTDERCNVPVMDLHVQMLDSDAAFLQSGVPSLWA